MRLLIDFHHPTLWESYNLTFVDRFGWDIYRPVGMEWFNKGYWQHEKFWANDQFAKMFLPHREGDIIHDGYSERSDPNNLGRTFKMVTVDQARDTDFDWVISSVPGNHLGFSTFAKENGAKSAVQIGNNEHTLTWGYTDLVLDSTSTHRAPAGQEHKHLLYDQEIDMGLYGNAAFSPSGPISSLLLVWHDDAAGLRFFQDVAAAFPDRFALYGQAGRELFNNTQVATEMAKSLAIWHTKKIGDGWGHTIHSAMAMGRPVIANNSYYTGQRASRLLDDNLGVFDIAGKTVQEVVRRIRNIDEDGMWIFMGELNRKRFRDVVDYERDAENILRAMS
jgi:hypothetical protein